MNDSQQILIKLSLDGDEWCALIGENLQVGIAGFGATKSDALHALISAIEEWDNSLLRRSSDRHE